MKSYRRPDRVQVTPEFMEFLRALRVEKIRNNYLRDLDNLRQTYYFQFLQAVCDPCMEMEECVDED